MKMIQNDEILQELKRKYPLKAYFTESLCPCYHYRSYEKDEFIQTPDTPPQYVHILLSGIIHIYALMENGAKLPVATLRTDGIVGNTDLFGLHTPLYAQAGQTSVCIAISLSDCKRILLDDIVFMRYNARKQAQVIHDLARLKGSVEDMDSKVLLYLKHRPGQTLSYVKEATYDLQCSRSSLQRSLVRLCEAGRIEKLKKGAYRLK